MLDLGLALDLEDKSLTQYSLLKEMESQGSYANRLDYITNRIVRASETYRIINERGFQLDAKSGGSHLNAWLAAISDFRTQAGI